MIWQVKRRDEFAVWTVAVPEPPGWKPGFTAGWKPAATVCVAATILIAVKGGILPPGNDLAGQGRDEFAAWTVAVPEPPGWKPGFTAGWKPAATVRGGGNHPDCRKGRHPAARQ